MGKLLSTKNRALPAVDGYVLKGNTDGSQFWAEGGIITINGVLVVENRDETLTNVSLSNYSFGVTNVNGSDVTVSSMLVTNRAGSDIPLQTFATSVS